MRHLIVGGSLKIYERYFYLQAFRGCGSGYVLYSKYYL